MICLTLAAMAVQSGPVVYDNLSQEGWLMNSYQGASLVDDIRLEGPALLEAVTFVASGVAPAKWNVRIYLPTQGLNPVPDRVLFEKSFHYKDVKPDFENRVIRFELPNVRVPDTFMISVFLDNPLIALAMKPGYVGVGNNPKVGSSNNYLLIDKPLFSEMQGLPAGWGRFQTDGFVGNLNLRLEGRTIE